MEEIGRRLRATRVAKGITLEEVEEETRIRKKYVEALESGRTVLIPGEVYVKGFLRTYGNFLGLDGEALVEEYKAHKSQPAEEPEPEAHVASAEPKRQTPVAETPRPSTNERAEETPRPPAFVQTPRRSGQAAQRDRHGRRTRGQSAGIYALRRVFVALVIVLPLAGAGYWLLNRPAAAPKPPPSTAEPNTPPVQQEPEQPVVEPEPEPEPEPVKPTVTMKGPDGNQVGFAVTAGSVKLRMEGFREGFPWMEWTVDDKVVFSGKPKGPIEYEGKKIVINVGYLSGVDLVVNDQRFPEPLEGGNYWITVTGQP